MKWYRFSLSMKKGDNSKFKKHLKYIQENYYPEFLSISQLNWAEMMKAKPIPEIEFISPCIDAMDIMDDFIETFNKDLVTSSANPHKWILYPTVTDKMKEDIKRLNKERKTRWKHEV